MYVALTVDVCFFVLHNMCLLFFKIASLATSLLLRLWFPDILCANSPCHNAKANSSDYPSNIASIPSQLFCNICSCTHIPSSSSIRGN
ncbi:hypothetical protein BGX38DRAFT_1156643 [Terfezia claveryi]|nr:hypothetical protein BGX38DRAFT_1156643 [Terfezia claveryi]